MGHTTVQSTQSKYSDIDYRRAVKIWELQEALACPSDIDLAHAIDHNVIGNTPFTRRDVRIAKAIFGPSIAGLKGKTVKPTTKMERDNKQLDSDPVILKEYNDIYLSIDVMHVNGIMFQLLFL